MGAAGQRGAEQNVKERDVGGREGQCHQCNLYVKKATKSPLSGVSRSFFFSAPFSKFQKAKTLTSPPGVQPPG